MFIIVFANNVFEVVNIVSNNLIAISVRIFLSISQAVVILLSSARDMSDANSCLMRFLRPRDRLFRLCLRPGQRIFYFKTFTQNTNYLC